MGSCRIVVGVDGPLGSGPATDWAAERAALETGRVVLLHVDSAQRPRAVHESLPESPSVPTAPESAAAPLLTSTAARVRECRPSVEVATREVGGRPDEVLVALGRDADLVVVGRPQRRHLGWRRSTCRHLLTRAQVPLVVVPAGARDRTGPVVVGLGTGPASAAALQFAAREARLRAVPLVAVHAWGDDDRLGALGGSAGLDDELEALLFLDRSAGEQGLQGNVSLLPLRGSPVTQLLACSWQAQLVVVGGSRRGRGWLGHTLPEALLRAGIRTPVAVVP